MTPPRYRRYILETVFLLACVNAAFLAANRFDLRSMPVVRAAVAYRAPAGADSWMPMKLAYDHVRAHPEIPVYSELFFRQHVKFQYPVSGLLVLVPFEAAGLDARTTYRLLEVLSQLSLLVLLGACGLLAKGLLDEGNEEGGGPTAVTGWAAVASTVLLAATFYPVYRAYHLGQVQLWIDALLALAFLCHRSGRHRWTGALLGLCTLVKPQYALFLVWGLSRRMRGSIAAFLAVIALGGGVSVVLFGWKNFSEYPSVLSYLSLHGESFFPNQSVNGLLNRFLGTGPSLVWLPHAFPGYHPVVFAATAASSAALAACALLLPLLRGAGGSLPDFGIFLLTCTMASPIAWEHHYGVLVPILILLFARLGRFRPAERVLLGISFVAVAAEHRWTNLFPAAWRGLPQSYLFFGALCILLLLYLLESRQGEPAG
ncbi:MAG: Polyprenol-phosphate-mannose-dependent alpha-(1-2)-phosphatidylinositol mannoside [Deltaproteobacteria bacterium]|nr:Polyprenol-phosphate-mannose-dependent alpha-(1-2)-phosphatidylinositol mannoside [Deltaproteobacteria bacterium]